MSQCNDRYLPLCSIPPRMSRDGNAGVNAHIYLSFVGFYFFNGNTITFPDSTAPQDVRPFVGGTTKPDTFTKDNLYCPGEM